MRRPCLLLLLLFVVASFSASDFYELLGVGRKASDKELKTAYRRLSKKYHPDKNPGDSSAHQKFVEISEAYEALSDVETRQIYDQYGVEGLERHKQGGGRQANDPFDLFSRFFGGGGHFGGGAQRRGPDMEVRISIPLKDFYTGAEHEFTVEKQHICEDCGGSGSADGAVHVCGQCGGRGIVIQKAQLAPGIFQQMQMQCDHCGGKGKTIARPCSICSGNRVVRKQSTFSLEVEKGMDRGQTVLYENEGDASPDWEAGNLVVHLDELSPKLGDSDSDRVDGSFFRRKGKELYWKEVLSLREAWMGGWTRNLTHLDGHVVQLSRKRGETVQPGSVEVLKGEGMPLSPAEQEHVDADFGTLQIHYTVILPDQIDKAMADDFWVLWEKWRTKKGINLGDDSGRPKARSHDEL